jgi:hypothetical protein
MKRFLIYSYYIIGLMILSNCETNNITDPQDYERKLVIDGKIESNSYPTVVLTYSSSYFSSIDSTTIRKMIASTAKVTVSDGVNEEILTLKKDPDNFPPYVYKGTELKGVEGKTYYLTVEVNNQKYTAATTIPPAAKFESLWFGLAEGKDSLGYLYGKINDDPVVDNYYRVFTERVNKDKRYIPVYLSAIGDQYFNGKSFTFSLLRGPESLTDVIDDLYFTKGDTIMVKFCTMDRPHFDFWRTLEREMYVIGNPFSSSGNEVISNIDGKKALGVWGGYGVTYYQVVAK